MSVKRCKRLPINISNCTVTTLPKVYDIVSRLSPCIVHTIDCDTATVYWVRAPVHYDYQWDHFYAVYKVTEEVTERDEDVQCTSERKGQEPRVGDKRGRGGEAISRQ